MTTRIGTGAVIQTYTGLEFDILDPQPEQIVIEDIAHALSLMNRFTGHTEYQYSVAQHSWLGSKICSEPLWFLLHDASEAYICDMSRPLKHFTELGKLYQPIESKIMRAICEKFGLPVVQPEDVHRIDTAMLFAEKKALMKPSVWATNWGNPEPAAVVIEEYTSRTIEGLFLERFHQLRRIQ